MDKVDILAIGAHPDDVELCAGGTLLRAIQQGKKVGLLDLTQGELGTNGDGPTRLLEAKEAMLRMGAQWRHNLGLRDGFIMADEPSILAVARIIRMTRPDIILANALGDRHPDHGRAATLVREACFHSGLVKIELRDDANQLLERWRPRVRLHYIQDNYIHPDIVVDITDFQKQKMHVVAAYASQFYQYKSGLKTPISGEDFWDFLEGRARDMGRAGGATLGEGFVSDDAFLINDLAVLNAIGK